MKRTLFHHTGDRVETRQTERNYTHVLTVEVTTESALYQNRGITGRIVFSWHGSEAAAVKGQSQLKRWPYYVAPRIEAINGGVQ